MDENLEDMNRHALVAVPKLRAGIRAHRDSKGHEFCWHHPALWSRLPVGGASHRGSAAVQIPARPHSLSSIS